MIENRSGTLWRVLLILIGLLVVSGLLMRFYNITQNDFFFYDEGYYLNNNRFVAELIDQHPPGSVEDFFKAYYLLTRASLATGKALWFLISDSRVFFLDLRDWFFPRLASAIAGSFTLVILFFFARRYYESWWVAGLSVGLLAVLPSHVFYSRLALQEACSTLLFLCGFYFYIYSRGINWRTFFSAILLAGAFFTNYRLIFLPGLVIICELFVSFAGRRIPDFRKYVWHTVTFFFLIFMIGNIDDAQNTVITFAWMFHQSNLAKQQFEWINLLSYPYYLFRLENVFFALFFFGNIYFIFRRQWERLLPFLLASVQMAVFSFAGEKGARYLCVVTPFMSMAVAAFIIHIFETWKMTAVRVTLLGLSLLMFAGMVLRSWEIARFKPDYRPAVEYLTRLGGNAKIVTTQPWILNLYTRDKQNVIQCPKEYRYLVQMYLDGFRYLVVDPQAYISWTQDGRRFSRNLKGYLGFIVEHIEPIKVFPHMNRVMLERFVLEHNENLRTSLQFLASNDEKLGTLRVYDIKASINEINRRVQVREEQTSSD